MFQGKHIINKINSNTFTVMFTQDYLRKGVIEFLLHQDMKKKKHETIFYKNVWTQHAQGNSSDGDTHKMLQIQ